MKKLSAEERAQREADNRFAEEALQEARQFAKLRLAFPDLNDKELAHRMTGTVNQVKALKRILGDKK